MVVRIIACIGMYFLHVRNVFPACQRCISCMSEICGIAGFTRENQVEKHVIMEHTKRSEDGNFLCIYPNCDVSTSSYTNFRTHLRIHKGNKWIRVTVITGTGIGLFFPDNFFLVPMMESGSIAIFDFFLDPEKQFVCNRPNCNERFITWHARSDHEKKVHGRWVCEHCGKVTRG